MSKLIQACFMIGLTLGISAQADECKMDTPVEIGTNDPRVSIVWDKRITLSDVVMDPSPDFKEVPNDLNPPASQIVALELYSPTGVCEGGERPLGGAFGLTNDCSLAKPMGSWDPAECDADFVDHGRVGFSHRYSGFSDQCETKVQNHNGTMTYSTRLFGKYIDDGVMVQIRDKKIIALELTAKGQKYCIRSGRKVTPHRYGKH